MSDELRLSEELAACEAHLAALPLAASQVNRDELMYRAGWAAREAAVVTPPSKGGARGGIPWRSHTLAAAIAASLAVAVTLGVTSSRLPSTEQIVDRPVLLAEVARETSAPAARSTLDAEMLLARWDGRGALSAGPPLLPLQRGGLELVSADVDVEEASPPRQPATARKLLDEMTPRNKSNAPAAGWPWQSFLGGNAI